MPAVSIAYGETFQALRRTTPGGSYRPQQEYLATVADRLRIWPEGAFEEIRPELLEALAESETMEEMTDRVGRVLNIDAGTRALRAEIRDVDRELDDDTLNPVARAELIARRRTLWAEHDETFSDWRWKARRIARTEAAGAVNSGQLAAAIEDEAETGERYHKRWLATDDVRTRATHRVADGQTVPLRGKFRVGGYLLDFPADPIVIAPHETINCRCALVIYDPDALQDELGGPDGSLGEIRPGGVRLGTDDPDAAAEAIRRVADDENRPLPPDPDARGEDHGQDAPEDTPEVELTDVREAPVGPRLDDFSRYSDEELLDALNRSVFEDDDELYEALNLEWDRREALADDDGDSGPDSGDGVGDELAALVAEMDDDDLADLIDSRADGDTGLLRAVEAERDRRDARDPDADDAPTDAEWEAWLDAEEQWTRDVTDWLDAERGWRQDAAKWLLAELAFKDPFPQLKKKSSHSEGPGSPKLIERESKSANRAYATDVQYRENCQKTVQAYELRRRGYDVQAQPGMGTMRDSTWGPENDFGKLWRMNGRPVGMDRVSIPEGKTGEAARDHVETLMRGWGPGARAWVGVDWIGDDDDRHMFCAEVARDGSVVFVDPQSGKSGDDVRNYFHRVKSKVVFMRVDHLQPVRSVLSMVFDREENRNELGGNPPADV